MAAPVQDHAPPPHAEDAQSSSLPNLCLDVVQEILIRLPPDGPESLVRAALVCKDWLGILCNDAFRRAYRAYHRSPPVMGILLNVREETDLVRLAPTTRLVPRTVDHEDLDVLDARHGRVLLHSFFSDTLEPMLLVWDPIIDARWKVKPPEIKFDSWTATVLCSDARCDHLQCHDAPFLVVFMVSDTAAGVTSAFRYRQGTNTWAEATNTNSPVLLNIKPAVLIGGSLFFRTLETAGRILCYDLLAERLSLIQPASMAQVPCRDYILLPGADGRLLLAKVQLSTLLLWETVVPPDGTVVTWLSQPSLNLGSPDRLLSQRYTGTYAVGFSEVHQVLYFITGNEFHSVHLNSRRISDRIFISGSLDNTVVPFVSFATADVVKTTLARYLPEE